MDFIMRARIHRFKDLVAVHLGDSGETLYIPATMAKEIGAQLIAAAHDCQTKDFTEDEGTYPTTLLEVDIRHNVTIDPTPRFPV